MRARAGGGGVDGSGAAAPRPLGCEEAEELRLEASWGPLAPRNAAALESHVAACVPCAAFVRDLDLLEKDLTDALREERRAVACGAPARFSGPARLPARRRLRVLGGALSALAAAVLVAIAAPGAFGPWSAVDEPTASNERQARAARTADSLRAASDAFEASNVMDAHHVLDEVEAFAFASASAIAHDVREASAPLLSEVRADAAERLRLALVDALAFADTH